MREHNDQVSSGNGAGLASYNNSTKDIINE